MNFHSNFQSIYNSEILSITTTKINNQMNCHNVKYFVLIFQISNKQIETIQSKKHEIDIDFVFEHTILFVCSQHDDNEQQSQQQIE
jgi:hypothetical protein